jgi:hypothetical protein
MPKATAAQLAFVVGGEVYDSGGGEWLVMIYRPDGRLVVYSAAGVALYHGFAAFENGEPEATVDRW